MTLYRFESCILTVIFCLVLPVFLHAQDGASEAEPPMTFDLVITGDLTEENNTGDQSACDSEGCDEESCEESSCEDSACDSPEKTSEYAEDTSAESDTSDEITATHHQTDIIKVHVDDLPKTSLHTFCLTATGEILAACGDGSSGDVRRFSATGDLIESWELPYSPEAINVGSEGHVYVAGDGKLSRYSIGGDLIGEGEHPFGDPTEEMLEKVRKQVIASHKQQLTWMSQQLEELGASVEKFEAKVKAEKEANSVSDEDLETTEEEPSEDSEEQTKQETAVAIYETLADDPDVQTFTSGDYDYIIIGGTAMIVPEATDEKTQYEAVLEHLVSQRDSYKQMIESQGEEELTEEQIQEKIKSSLKYKMKVASISEADGEVFLATGSQQGYGFSVWKTNRYFEAPEMIVKQLSGCCGQMDVQACCDGIYVAENSRHKVRRYDRTGEEVCNWGSGSREGLRGFGGCCNPMNVAFGPDQTVYTAESETGRIKRFTNDGELIELVGKADLVPGCKKVSIAIGPKGDRVYMLDITRNHILMLERPSEGEVVSYSESNKQESTFAAVFDSSERSEQREEIEVDSVEGFFRSLGRAMAKSY